MESVDLTKLKIGDTIIFRDSNRRAQVTCNAPELDEDGDIRVDFEIEGRKDYHYFNPFTGKISLSVGEHNYDIIQVIPGESAANEKNGAKYDSGKLMFNLLTRGLALPLRAVAAVLTYGAQKYKADSWKDVPNAEERYAAAMDRHVNARAAGEVFDEESGLPHAAHIACNALFLLWFEIKELEKTKTPYTKFNEVKKNAS